MSTSTAPPIKVCNICGRILDVHRKAGQPDRFLHIDSGVDHEAVPVDPADAAVVDRRCDFCLAAEPTVEVPVRDFNYADHYLTDHGSLGSWLACPTCGALIDRGHWSGLLQRAISTWEGRHHDLMAPEAIAALRTVYRQIRRHQAGPTKPFVAPEQRSC